jgi:hypothetical protein
MAGIQHSLYQEMAAEYSRQLSEKVHYGSMKVSQQGYSAGGTACYGMARLLLSESKEPIRILKKGEHKQIANERVTFIPLGDETNDTIREIFRLVVDENKLSEEIADTLNVRGILAANDAAWTRGKVLTILSNETYAGSRVYNKIWGRLKQKPKRNPRSDWVIQRNAFPAIVSLDTFLKAQEKLHWMLPKRYKRGTYAISKVRRHVRKKMEEFLAPQNLTEEELAIKLQETPVLYSIVSKDDDVFNWCFVIPEHARKQDVILAVSVDADVIDEDDLIERAFLMPTTDFSATNLMLLSKEDPRFSSYYIEGNVEEKLRALL